MTEAQRLARLTNTGKGACENGGAISHDSKSCVERPRKVGAKWTDKHIAPDEKIETFELDYDAKRDPWNGYDPSSQALVVERYERTQEAQRKHQVDEAKVEERKQVDFAKVEKHVRTIGGGSTGTAKNFVFVRT